MRRIELLIDQSRSETENVEFTAGTGISDEEFIRWANDAQYRIQAKITQQNEKIFISEDIFSTQPQVEKYNLPDDILWNNRVVHLEISDTGNVDDYIPLEQETIKARNTITSGMPGYYIRLGGQVLLNPVPDASRYNIRLTYVKRLNRLDKRRATVSAVTTSGNSITTLTLDTAAILDKDILIQENYFSVVDSDGLTTMRRVKFTDIDETTGIVTIDPSFEFLDGESISVGDYLVRGKFGTNAHELPDTIERYIVTYMNWKALKRDSSADAAEAAQELRAMEEEIIEDFSDVDDDIFAIPITSGFMLDDDEIF